LTIVNAFIDNRHMPLLFFLAVAATLLALHKRSGPAYGRERALRLMVLFAFGILTVVLHDVIVKRWNSLRFLFGMRPVKTI
jgi:hypothetical protein